MRKGKEAEFFASCEELLDKVKFYCSNESARKRIAEGGYKRCNEGGYAYVHRLSDALRRLGADLRPTNAVFNSRESFDAVCAALSDSPRQAEGDQLALASSLSVTRARIVWRR